MNCSQNPTHLKQFFTFLSIYFPTSQRTHDTLHKIKFTTTAPKSQQPKPSQKNRRKRKKMSISNNSTTSSRECCTVSTNDGLNLDARVYRPITEHGNGDTDTVIVMVHPFAILGGCQGLMKGMARGLADRGITSVTFDSRGAGKSTGRASITGFPEVNDVISVCKWVVQNMSARRIILVGSSAGAPIAGSAVDKIEEVVGYVSLGYPFGLTASILFGRHHKAILQSPKPKLFVMGTKDGFTSVKQLENKLKNASGRIQTHLIDGVSHFQMEGPTYDAQMVDLITEFVSSL